jgi:hypothetical protein
MNLKDQILEESVKQMQQAMDFEILADVMCRFGWHLIELDRYTDNYHAIDVREWVAENCSGEHRSHGAAWLFKDQGDAVLFKLRWS